MTRIVADGRRTRLLERGGTWRRANRSTKSRGKRDLVERQLCRLHGSIGAPLGRRQRDDGGRRTAPGSRQLRVHRRVFAARYKQGRDEDRQGTRFQTWQPPPLDAIDQEQVATI